MDELPVPALVVPVPALLFVSAVTAFYARCIYHGRTRVQRFNGYYRHYSERHALFVGSTVPPPRTTRAARALLDEHSLLRLFQRYRGGLPLRPVPASLALQILVALLLCKLAVTALPFAPALSLSGLLAQLVAVAAASPLHLGLRLLLDSLFARRTRALGAPRESGG